MLAMLRWDNVFLRFAVATCGQYLDADSTGERAPLTSVDSA